MREQTQGLKLMPQFEVEPFEGTFTREVYVAKKDEKGKHLGFDKKLEEVKGGFMVYFPAGHSTYVETEEELARLGLTDDAKLVDMNSGDIVENSVISLKNRSASKTKNVRQ